MNLKFAKVADADLLNNDFLGSLQPIVGCIEQQSRDDKNDRRTDHKKNPAHERGIQQSQAEPKRHSYSNLSKWIMGFRVERNPRRAPYG